MATNDYSGNVCTMESFTAQTTDGSGNIDLTVQSTPAADDAIILYCNTPGYVVEFDSRTAKVITVLITKLGYHKVNNPVTGSLGNLPGGVTEATAKANTDSGVGADSNCVEGVDGQTGSHVHGLSYTYRHDHTLGYTLTDMPVADTQGGLTITIVYAIA